MSVSLDKYFVRASVVVVVLLVVTSPGAFGAGISEDVLTEEYLEEHRQPNDIGRNLTYDFLPDDGIRCARNCTDHPQARTCYYKFVLEQYSAMGPACTNCQEGNTTACLNPACVQGDGIQKTVLTINRMIMGPQIQVCYNDRIIVDIENKMPARELTMHWHGIFQIHRPYMDGVPSVTQCAIAEGQHFRYDFIADTKGTHFYHTHTAFSEFEGISGVLIVREPDDEEPNRDEYDRDLFAHICHLADWMHVLADDRYPGQYSNLSVVGTEPDSLLINGFGTYFFNDTAHTPTPIVMYVVEKGFRYRFRIVTATSLVCTYKVTFQGHPMTLISTDGHPVEPVEVRTIFVQAGELFDVVINANQEIGCYWIRVQGTNACEGAKQYGVLCYLGATGCLNLAENNEELFNSLVEAEDPYKYQNLNDLQHGCTNNPDNLCMDEVRSLERVDDRYLQPEPDCRLTLRLAAHFYNNSFLFPKDDETYKRFYVPVPRAVLNDNINNKSNTFPPGVFYRDDPPPDRVCPKECAFCECFHYYEIQTGAVVELVILDEVSRGPNVMMHPMHLHGQPFAVLLQANRSVCENAGYISTEPNVDTCKIKNSTQTSGEQTPFLQPRNCTEETCTDRPNVRDVASVPPAGCLVIRFIASNPGVWAFHCHFVIHNHNGMSLIFKIGEREEFKPLPPDWPTCGDYVPSPPAKIDGWN